MATDKNKPNRLLIIDDEQIVGRRLKHVFSKIGFEVEVFTDAQEALEEISKKAFDVVITDLKMDKIDGIEILGHVKSMSPDTQVIIITGYASEETSSVAYKRGVFEFLAKPFRLDTLKQIILRALEDKKRKSL